VYGRSKAEAEQRVLEADPQALIIRTSSFFGPWDKHNFVTQALGALKSGQTFEASNDLVVSPTYVPDLVNASLDLMIDRERGVWHLTNAQAVTWAELARKACEIAGVDASGLRERASTELGYKAVRPAYSALSSERGLLLPSLEDALKRYIKALDEHAVDGGELAGEAAHYAS
jgi:dTDP-4-dehydrorhamnose reductase